MSSNTFGVFPCGLGSVVFTSTHLQSYLFQYDTFGKQRKPSYFLDVPYSMFFLGGKSDLFVIITRYFFNSLERIVVLLDHLNSKFYVARSLLQLKTCCRWFSNHINTVAIAIVVFFFFSPLSVYDQLDLVNFEKLRYAIKL